MNREPYVVAELHADSVDEIRLVEKKLSERCGKPITLIAYRAEDADADDALSRNL
mgnify:CR=1 FL=1